MTSNTQTPVYGMCNNVVDELYDFYVYNISQQSKQLDILNNGFECIIYILCLGSSDEPT